MKNQAAILAKLSIAELNPMQQEMEQVIRQHTEVVLLSPTGTGKTLAFLLPLIQRLEASIEEVQLLILVPSRELAIQIEQVVREMGAGYKVNAVYGGKSGSMDKVNLKHRPAILIGTPGRVADHLRKETFSTSAIRTLVLDEFDKSLEVGFEAEMKEIIANLPTLKQRILTSATDAVNLPAFVGLQAPKHVNYLKGHDSQLQLKRILSPSKDKLETLLKTLCFLGNRPGIVFCNFKESIQRLSDYLRENGIEHGCFHGDMEQGDREKSLLKFRNGSHQLLLATDLAARGIDVPTIEFIIHYQLPSRSQEFTHRNGRTARMNANGSAYLLQWENEPLPDFIENLEVQELKKTPLPSPPLWKTLYVSGGRRDKISKGDVAGLFFKKGNLKKEELGIIEIKQDCAFVAVVASKAGALIHVLNNSRLKKRKIRVNELS